MKFTDRFNIRTLVSCAGLCATGIALCSAVAIAAAPLATAECGPGAPAGKECGAPASAFAPMAGVPLALPGPVPAPVAPVPIVPAAPAIPVIPAAPVPVVPGGAPLAGAPVAGGSPVGMAGGYAGKGDRVGAPPTGAPLPGQPLPAGPPGAS